MSLILAFYMLFALGRALGSMIRSFRQQDTSGPVVVADASDDDDNKNFRLRLDVPFLGGPGFGPGHNVIGHNRVVMRPHIRQGGGHRKIDTK